MSGQNSSCEVVDLNLPPRLPSCALQAQVDSPDSGEQRTEGHLVVAHGRKSSGFSIAGLQMTMTEAKNPLAR
jgi:hypothetical protein